MRKNKLIKHTPYRKTHENDPEGMLDAIFKMLQLLPNAMLSLLENPQLLVMMMLLISVGDVNRDSELDEASRSEDKIVVGLIDGGIQIDHPFIKSYIVENPAGSNEQFGCKGDRNGCSFGGSQFNGQPIGLDLAVASPETHLREGNRDRLFHGTLMARAVTKEAAPKNLKILPVLVGPYPSILNGVSVSSHLLALKYLAAHQVKVVLLSGVIVVGSSTEEGMNEDPSFTLELYNIIKHSETAMEQIGYPLLEFMKKFSGLIITGAPEFRPEGPLPFCFPTNYASDFTNVLVVASINEKNKVVHALNIGERPTIAAKPDESRVLPCETSGIIAGLIDFIGLQNYRCSSFFTRSRGGCQPAAVVTRTVVAMLAVKPDLLPQEIIEILISTAYAGQSNKGEEIPVLNHQAAIEFVETLSSHSATSHSI